MKTFLLFIWAIAPVCLSAQSYDVKLIPDSLKKNARAVVREDEYILEIKSPGKAVTKERHVYTILDETADNVGGYRSLYGKFNSISSISGYLYDAGGKELKHVKKKDMEDRSYVSWENLIDDERYKEHDFYYRTYPYTVDYQEEDEFNGLMGFSAWRPLHAPGISTQHSKYVIIAPADYKVRYKPFNCSYQPVIAEVGGKKIYTWEIGNLAARSTETSGPGWSAMAPVVLIAPSDFEVEGYKGNMSTWTSYGKFIDQLRAGRDVLPEEIKKKVHELTDNLKDPRDKVYALYDFLQKNTHYVSIQLGIGGWQPFPAEYVATKRYGDCKALSNYMVALLKEAGITGKYVEIAAEQGAAPLIEDFPCSQFNHVISCVPMGKDTIWLECTSQTGSPGYMGSFTGDRKAVIIDSAGAHVVSTPSYSSSDNLESRVINASIDADGNLDANSSTYYSCLAQEMPHFLIHDVSGEQREKYLNQLFNLPTYKVDKSSYEEIKGAKPAVKEYLHVTSPGYAGVSGKRMFISPNLFDKSSIRFSPDSARRYDLVYNHASRDVDSISLTIPDGYTPESVPQDVKIDCKFGKYSASLKLMPGKITYYRIWEQNRYRYPASDYPEFVKYYEQIYKADHARVVLVKKE
ncbi:MAG: DUF3857 domain-containing protein [Puia sp.]|nr:DUF3857 domain-containing protein [Puia sp.]